MKDPWFRWEREATIHLLFPTLEGSMGPLKDFSGFGFPTTILIFKNGIVTWCTKNSEFYELGAKLLKIYQDYSKEQQMVDKANKRLKELRKVEKEIKRLTPANLTNIQLLSLYSRLHNCFIRYYGIGAIQEPLAMKAEENLKTLIGLTDEQLASLVAPNKLSYIQEAQNYFLQTKDKDRFIKKYFWIDNNYSQTKVLTKKAAEKILSRIKLTPIPTQNSANLDLSPKAKRLVELLKNFGGYQDERKKNILIYLHFLEILLKEIGRRSNISLSLMRDSFPQEIKDLLDGKKLKDFINKRSKKCIVVWQENKDRPTILIGDKGKKYEALLSVPVNRLQVINGFSASKGKVIGKVRILLNASDNDKLKVGEILVTFMTSPDFMGAIRKCSAIVTNFGGVTSHAAIISRELGIPCIIGTNNATAVLKNGDLVEVDADKGEVKIL